ncbi:MAG: nucleotidyltransferase family protein [Ruminiclostridium sp.]|nr:nucleotidyltransferase family protein [Ruminiclostridium sp.]
MHTIGIIAEYNPFHSGHQYQLDEIRNTFGRDCAVVCVMSGNWVQRGDAAITDKWNRALMALQGGADLILELPTLWAASSAETFARGGVSLLDATGVVNTLCFGSESGTLAPLEQVVSLLETTEWQDALRVYINRGLSFPVARQKAAGDLLGDNANCLRSPNNNLAIEYLRAMQTLDSSMTPYTIQRLGSPHDGQDTDGQTHMSASYLRTRIRQNDSAPLLPYLRPEDEALLRLDSASLINCTRGVLARLRAMEDADFLRLPDSGEGLGHKLYLSARKATTLEQLYSLTKSKRYTHARIRRMVLWAFLGLTADDRLTLPPYLRVLGFSPRGQQVLRNMKSTASIPVIVKPSHVSRLDPEPQRIFHLEARCTELFDLCRRGFGITPGKNEYTQSPIRV